MTTTLTLALTASITTLSSISAWAQPTPAPSGPDLPCMESAAVDPNDTLPAPAGVDADGFLPLFDGTFKGWSQSCGTGHSGGSKEGAIFRTGLVDGKPALYSTQRGPSTGGVMMTKAKFGNYEIRFQAWPEFGNNAGIFNRTLFVGQCFKTTLDYAAGESFGGSWGEGGFIARDFRPFSFAKNPGNLSIPGNGAGESSNWTAITRKLKATTEPKLPCPDLGCTGAEWSALWDTLGWNEIKIQFYGGLTSGGGTIHMKTWFKKPSADVWVPIIQDTTLNQVIPPGYIGIEVAGAGEFGGPKGNWYRDIRWKPLNDKGEPLYPQATGIESNRAISHSASHFTANASTLSGNLDQAYSVFVNDVEGHALESFSGPAGKVEHLFTTQTHGILFLRIRTARGVESAILTRPPEL